VDSGSLFHFPHHCVVGDLRRFISISHTVTGQHEALHGLSATAELLVTKLGEMTNAGKILEEIRQPSKSGLI